MAIIYRGRVTGSYYYWNENDLVPSGATNITVVNVPVLTASHVDRSVYAPDGISGSLTQLTGSTSFLIAGTNITIASASNGPITISSTGGDTYWQSDINDVIYTTGSVEITGSVELGVDGAGRGLLRVGTLDISPITGSAQTTNISPSISLNGNVLSASNGVWDGANEVALRHEFHVLGAGRDSLLNINQIAATYLVMTNINSSGVQTAIAVTEVSREVTGSYTSGWDINVNTDCSIAVTGGMDAGKPVYWYVQRVKEMALRTNGSRT
jgi:hypothetical protein